MSATQPAHSQSGQPTRDQINSALFANLVLQQTNMAMMLLGQAPNPQTEETAPDLDSARVFIDQLEMLAEKTKGNLSKAEEQLLRQNLTALQMAFVECVNAEGRTPSASSSASGQPTPPPGPAATSASGQDTTPGAIAEEEHRKKFSKKY